MLGARTICAVLLFLAVRVSGIELFDMTDSDIRTKSRRSDCRARKKGSALKIVYGHKSRWPSIYFSPDKIGYPADWSEFGLLAITLSNPTDRPVKPIIRLDSAAAKERKGRSFYAQIEPGQKVRLLLPFGGREPIIGMRGQPPMKKLKAGDVMLDHNRIAVDPAQIRGFQIFLSRPETDCTLLLHKVELLKPDELESPAFVDRFGQYNGADWPGKLHSEKEFPKRLKTELADIAAHPRIRGWDKYGGWAGGPQLDATGHFRVQKYRGKWWLVDPAGRLFWSSGIDCVNLRQQTIITGREQYFEWLPKEGDPLYAMMRGRKRRQMNFFEANLYRKYGKNYKELFFRITANRFCSWGINTIGNWSDPLAWCRKKVPYVVNVSLPGVPHFLASSHMKAGLEKKKWFPDPFDPRFAKVLNRQLGARAEILKDDPWLLGVFIDNELPWRKGKTRISALSLRNGPEFTIKQKLVDELKKRYPTIGKLNAAWGTRFQSWEKVFQPLELSVEQQKAADADLAKLDLLIARQYFRLCREAMDRHLPGILYLGCRFNVYTREILQVASEYCDVVSFNIYEYDPRQRTVDEMALEMDFPVIIGEFHFGALDRGMFDPGLRRAENQQDRAEKYAAYIRVAAEAPWCIGAHWFQYTDQPLTGRADGENYNIGFIDVTDDPYPEMVAAARRIHTQLYQLRANTSKVKRK